MDKNTRPSHTQPLAKENHLGRRRFTLDRLLDWEFNRVRGAGLVVPFFRIGDAGNGDVLGHRLSRKNECALRAPYDPRNSLCRHPLLRGASQKTNHIIVESTCEKGKSEKSGFPFIILYIQMRLMTIMTIGAATTNSIVLSATMLVA